MPLLESALAALNTLTKADITEVSDCTHTTHQRNSRKVVPCWRQTQPSNVCPRVRFLRTHWPSMLITLHVSIRCC
jgi:hypothetical protein